MKRAAIYRITNTRNGKVYIGSSKDVSRRLNVHRWQLRRGRHDNAQLQIEWDRDGEAVFTFEIVEDVIDLSTILVSEQAWIAKLKSASAHHGFNACPVAGTREGAKQPNGFAAMISAVHKGKPKSAETRAKMSAAALGRKKSPEHKQRLREAAERQFSDPAARAKAAEYGAQASGFKGKSHSQESIAKLSAAHKARYRDPVWLAAQTPRTMSQEARQKISDAKRGGKASPETLAKMTAAHKARWAKLKS